MKDIAAMAKLDFKRAQQAQDTRVKRFQQAMSEGGKQQINLSFDLSQQIAAKCQKMMRAPSDLFKPYAKFYEPDEQRFASKGRSPNKEDFVIYAKFSSEGGGTEIEKMGQDMRLLACSETIWQSLPSSEVGAAASQNPYVGLSTALYFLLLCVMASQALSFSPKNSSESNAKDEKPSIRI